MFIIDNQLPRERITLLIPFIEPLIIRELINVNPIEEYIENEGIDLSFLDQNYPKFIYNFMNYFSKNYVVYISIVLLILYLEKIQIHIMDFVYISYSEITKNIVLA